MLKSTCKLPLIITRTLVTKYSYVKQSCLTTGDDGIITQSSRNVRHTDSSHHIIAVSKALDVIDAAESQITESIKVINDSKYLLDGIVECKSTIRDAPIFIDVLTDTLANPEAVKSLLPDIDKASSDVTTLPINMIEADTFISNHFNASDSQGIEAMKILKNEKGTVIEALNKEVSIDSAKDPSVIIGGEAATEEIVLEAVVAKEVVEETVPTEEVGAEEVFFEGGLAEEIIAKEVILETVGAEKVVLEAASTKVVLEASSNKGEDVAEKVVFEEVAAEEVVMGVSASTESADSPEYVDTAPTVRALLPDETFSNITVSLSSQSKKIAKETKKDTKEELSPLSLSVDQISAIRTSCASYVPLGERLSVPFSKYITLKTKLGEKKKGPFMYFMGGLILYSSASYSLFPSYYSVDAATICGIEPLLFIGGSTVLLAGLTAVLGSSLRKKLTLGYYGSYKKAYQKRDADFVRRVNHYHCSDKRVMGSRNDLSGQNITSLVQYRSWVRLQQENQEKSRKTFRRRVKAWFNK